MPSALPSRALPSPARPAPAHRLAVGPTRLPVVVLLSLLLTLLATGLTPALTAEAATKPPGFPSGVPRAIEALARYVPNNSCTPGDRAGTDRLAAMLKRTYGVSVGTSRGCDGSVTEHSDGRAVDLMLSVRNSSQKADGKALMSWLLATDRYGNKFANARRLGVMYVIWDNKIWASYRTGDGWREYSGCSKRTSKAEDTACHRDHVHLSLSWEGASGMTSWWSKKVAAPRWGSCPAAGMNWAPSSTSTRTTACPSHQRLVAPSKASAAYKALVPWAGMYLRSEATGAPVRAWQQALKVPVTGRWDSATRSAVRSLQRASKIPDSGNANSATWRAMLKRHAPR